MVDLGLGIAQKKEISTASTYTITAEELQKTSAITLLDALYGRLLGLNTLRGANFSGDQWYGGYFNIRGTQTSTENDILILVDGLERPIDRLPIDEVESVTVFKDAAATALYGYKGVNGVISVKTKRSKSDDLAVKVRFDRKFQSAPKTTEFIDAHTYAMALNEARTLDGLTPAYNKQELDAFKNGTYPNIYPNVDWKSEALRDAAFETQANLSISGGNDNLKYLTSCNLVNASGLLSGTEVNEGYSTQLKYSKGNVRVNIDFKLTPTTNVHAGIMGYFVETNRPHGIDANGIFQFFNNTPASAYPVMMSDGTTWGGTTAYGADNIIARIRATGHNKTHEKGLLADAKFVQNLDMLLKGLSASARFGYDNRSEIVEERKRSFEYGNTRYIFGQNDKVTDSIQFIGGNKASHLQFGKWLNSQWRSFNFQANIDYVNQFDIHNVAASLIYTANSTVFSGRHNEFNRVNLALYGHYDYDNRYVADLNLVGSGSNRSWPQKYALSPTLALGWVVSNEGFLEDVEAVNLLKLRASAGVLYSDYVPRVGLSLEDYGTSRGWFVLGKDYRETWGNFLSYFPTGDFALEQANKFNIGLELKLWESFELLLESYYQRRNNILQSADEINSTIVGIPSSYINKGVVDSKGFEAGLSYNKSFNDLKVNLTALFSYGANKIVDMVEAPLAYAYLSRIGHPVGQPFGLEAIGFFESEADIKSSPLQEFDRVRPGDIKYKDQNNDGLINENDVVAIGYTGTPEINYSFNVGLEYKGLGFNILFQGVENYTHYLNTQGVFNPMVNNSNLSTHYFEHCWRPGQDNSEALYPRLTTLASPNNYRSSSAWYANASFLKLRNCEIYYKFQTGLFGLDKMKGLKIYAKGENLLSLHDLPANIDPENTWGGYPALIGISVGASVIF
ncbi:MAG TPA: SusC/RagA family TonB-linked outer membrane protein [Petrimonas sp.]|nr:SusC/RagA family TonB-linked outer membrane protein [Petrimonas sp.]